MPAERAYNGVKSRAFGGIPDAGGRRAPQIPHGAEWTFTRDETAPGGWWTAWSPEFRLYRDGPTREEALRSLARAVAGEVLTAMRDPRGTSARDDFVAR